MATATKKVKTVNPPKIEKVTRLDQIVSFPNTWDFPFLEDLTGANPQVKGANGYDRDFVINRISDYLESKYGFREVKSQVIETTATHLDKSNGCKAFFFVDTVQEGELTLFGSALTTTGGKTDIEPEKGLLVLTAGVKSFKLHRTPSQFRTVIVFSYKKAIAKK